MTDDEYTVGFENGSYVTVGDSTELEGLHDPFDFQGQYEWELRKAYQLGVLHGINAQSMAQVKNGAFGFEDYGWEVDDD